METVYRLGEFKIIASGINALRWESHLGLGAFQKGKCFRKGSILFIGPPETAAAGFLKGEFLDHINALPAWLTTPYYCMGSDVYHCKTGNRVAIEEMLSWMLGGVINKGGRPDSEQPEKFSDTIAGIEETSDIAFRLQRYEIVKKTSGQVCWRTHAGPNTTYSGNCIVIEDILFIESFQSKQSDVNKRVFQTSLRQLTTWDHTRFYTPKLSLLDCKSGDRVWNIKTRQEENFVAEKKQGIVNRKKTAEVAKPETDDKRAFSASVSDILDSFFKAAARYRVSVRSLWFKCKNPNTPKRIADFRITSVRRWITYAIALILLSISLFFVFLIGYWNEHREKSHHKRGEHGANDHRYR